MIPANHLRLGNIVMDDSGWIVVTPLLLFEIDSNKGIVKPIELTPEILEKTGFEELVQGVYEIANELILHEDSMERFYGNLGIYGLSNGDYFTGSRIIQGVKIKYLHQLQNLYFALAGEELNIEL